MHIHVPKPLHGWKEFANEIFVIVIGVLIALGFEQVVEWAHWQHKVEDGEERLSRELKFNYIASANLVTYGPCVLAQLDAIRDNLLDPNSKAISIDPAVHNFAVLRAPTGLSPTNTWKSLLADGTVLHMPADKQYRLNILYDRIGLQSNNTSETGEVSGRLLAASYRPIPDALRGQLLLEVAAQYRRTQVLISNSLGIMRAIRSEGYAASDEEVAKAQEFRPEQGFRTPIYCRQHNLPLADWRSEMKNFELANKQQQ